MKINLNIDDGIEEEIVDFKIKKLTENVQKAINLLNEDEPRRVHIIRTR